MTTKLQTSTKFYNETEELAQKYACSRFENTYYLGYRDIPNLIKKHSICSGKKAIDYGCGTGRSTRFLEDLGYQTLGVDTSLEMLDHALDIPSESHYLYIESGVIPVASNSYDLSLACFVMLTISNTKEMLDIFKEIYRCLKPGGIFIIVTASEELYRRKWLSYDVNFSTNNNPTSGSLTRIALKDVGVEYVNYYWTDNDYCRLFKAAKLHLVEKHFPLGIENEERKWASETVFPPYAIYVLRKELPSQK